MKTPILVEWYDISLDPGWHDQDDLGNAVPHPCVSVGFRMKSEKGFMRLVGTVCDATNKCTDILSIPRGCIKSIRSLK